MCDYFLDMACYCLHTNTEFFIFKKVCKEKKCGDGVDNEIFCILKAESNVSHATYIACCRNFVDFEIQLFKANSDTFPLATVACTYAERRRYGDVDFDYGVDNLQVYYDEDFNSDNNDTDKVTFRLADALNSFSRYEDRIATFY